MDGGGHQRVTDCHSLDEVEDPQYDRHDDDLRVAVEPGCAGYDCHDNLDMRIQEGFRATFLADPQRQYQRERQCWSKWERGVFKHADSFRKDRRRRVFLRIPTVGLTRRTERRERSTDTIRTRYPDPTYSVGRSIGGKPSDDEERRFGDVLVRQEGMVEGWVSGEDIDWICRDVGFESDVANR